jgi:hypothetical protein
MRRITMVDSITDCATSHSMVKAYASGLLCLAYDPVDGNLAIAGDGVFGFDLAKGVSTERAAETAGFLHDHLVCMTHTTL